MSFCSSRHSNMERNLTTSPSPIFPHRYSRCKRACALLQKLTDEGKVGCVTKGILKEVDRWVCSQKGRNTLSEDWIVLARDLLVLRPNHGEVLWEAGHILTHYPDNLHIASAKLENTSLVSYDYAMIRTARDEGLSAYYPAELLRAN